MFLGNKAKIYKNVLKNICKLSPVEKSILNQSKPPKSKENLVFK